MANIIHVTPAKLTSTAGTFETTGNEVRNLTTQMTNTVQQFSGRVWSGEAASSYVSKFNNLQGDINKLVQMITNHSQQLREIAREYETSETQNVSEANSLGSIIS